ncbi:unnamed protein product [Spirodela intermedia]|uniref:Uncharacterized protein n=1 Tax=Spirodela intermedia TaxID=51605 RepID=A0A7I8LG28_SPIIN|nr:unnamed protein product [Spirodela intermedia]
MVLLGLHGGDLGAMTEGLAADPRVGEGASNGQVEIICPRLGCKPMLERLAYVVATVSWPPPVRLARDLISMTTPFGAAACPRRECPRPRGATLKGLGESFAKLRRAIMSRFDDGNRTAAGAALTNRPKSVDTGKVASGSTRILTEMSRAESSWGRVAGHGLLCPTIETKLLKMNTTVSRRATIMEKAGFMVDEPLCPQLLEKLRRGVRRWGSAPMIAHMQLTLLGGGGGGKGDGREGSSVIFC